jgi:hypothetical protein
LKEVGAAESGLTTTKKAGNTSLGETVEVVKRLWR